MSTDPLVSNAQNIGRLAAYEDMLKVLASLMDNSPPYSDLRPLQELVQYCNDRILMLRSGTIVPMEEETSHGA